MWSFFIYNINRLFLTQKLESRHRKKILEPSGDMSGWRYNVIMSWSMYNFALMCTTYKASLWLAVWSFTFPVSHFPASSFPNKLQTRERYCCQQLTPFDSIPNYNFQSMMWKCRISSEREATNSSLRASKPHVANPQKFFGKSKAYEKLFREICQIGKSDSKQLRKLFHSIFSHSIKSEFVIVEKAFESSSVVHEASKFKHVTEIEVKASSRSGIINSRCEICREAYVLHYYTLDLVRDWISTLKMSMNGQSCHQNCLLFVAVAATKNFLYEAL